MRRIAYRLPRYPMQERHGDVLHEGPDGILVKNDETRLEERVRHRDVIRDLDGRARDEVIKSLSHQFVAHATGDTLRNLASQYGDQYAPGHPAHLDASQCDWEYDPAFEMANLPGTPEEWIAYNAEQGRSLGFASNPTPIIVVQAPDGHHYIWDGNHRTGEAYAAGWTHVPAIVGRSRIRDDQPEPDLPPGSVLRSGLRKSLDGPLVLLARGHRLDAAVRMQITTLAKAIEIRQVAGRQHIHQERYPEGHGHAGEGIAEYGPDHLNIHHPSGQVAMVRPEGMAYHTPARPTRPAAPAAPQAPAPGPATHVAHVAIHPGIAAGHRLTVVHYTPQHVAIHNHATGMTHEMPTSEWHRHLASSAVAAHHELMKALPSPGRPSAQPQIPQPVASDQPPVLGQWPLVAQPRYAPDDWVQYQRPDMAEPQIGKVASHGAEHGTWVAPGGGEGRHKVRWEHIHGRAMVGVAPEERHDGAATLARMGVPIDPLEHTLLPDRAERPNPHLLARLQALIDDGAPIDPAAAKSAGAAALRRAIEHFAGPLPREEEQRPQRPTMRPSARLSPWSED